MRAIPRVFGIGSLSFVQAKKRPRFCMTIITLRAITVILAGAKRHTLLRRRAGWWPTSSLTREQRQER